jgi:hypothetical protein
MVFPPDESSAHHLSVTGYFQTLLYLLSSKSFVALRSKLKKEVIADCYRLSRIDRRLYAWIARFFSAFRKLFIQKAVYYD